MNMDDLSEYFAELGNRIGEAIEGDIPDIVGVEAVNHFKAGFENEGFTDNALERWPEVKRRMGRGKGAAASRKILTGETGNLKESVTYDKEPGKVTVSANPANVSSGTNYAGVHNFGTNNAGRNRNVTIPKRQFVGESEVLNDKIKERIESRINEILQQL